MVAIFPALVDQLGSSETVIALEVAVKPDLIILSLTCKPGVKDVVAEGIVTVKGEELPV